jgi:hypothetical protein
MLIFMVSNTTVASGILRNFHAKLVTLSVKSKPVAPSLPPHVVSSLPRPLATGLPCIQNKKSIAGSGLETRNERCCFLGKTWCEWEDEIIFSSLKIRQLRFIFVQEKA